MIEFIKKWSSVKSPPKREKKTRRIKQVRFSDPLVQETEIDYKYPLDFWSGTNQSMVEDKLKDCWSTPPDLQSCITLYDFRNNHIQNNLEQLLDHLKEECENNQNRCKMAGFLLHQIEQQSQKACPQCGIKIGEIKNYQEKQASLQKNLEAIVQKGHERCGSFPCHEACGVQVKECQQALEDLNNFARPIFDKWHMIKQAQKRISSPESNG